jgi:hypothetical protein
VTPKVREQLRSHRGEGTQLARNRDTRYFGLRELTLKRKTLMKASLARPGFASRAAPSPARHGGCKKNRYRRAAYPLPQLSGRGIFRRRRLLYSATVGRGIFRKTSCRESYCPLTQPGGQGTFRRTPSRDSLWPSLRSQAGEGSSERRQAETVIARSGNPSGRRPSGQAPRARGSFRKEVDALSCSGRGSFRKLPSGDS